MPQPTQTSFFDLHDTQVFPVAPPVVEAIARLADSAGVESRGAVYTRPEVVDFILDLLGYLPSKPLVEKRILEPSVGGGDFLLPIIDRLLESLPSGQKHCAEDLCCCIRAVELHRATYAVTLERVEKHLANKGFSDSEAAVLANSWLRQGDFLLEPFEDGFDFVAGNPPYVRQEHIPSVLLAEYRSRFTTFFDRADLYIPFIERSLNLLKPEGALAFICSDRWMKNRYGGPLRALVARNFHLSVYVDMVGTDAFFSEVSAYPAITVIDRSRGEEHTAVVRRPAVSAGNLRQISEAISAGEPADANRLFVNTRVERNGTEPWILDSNASIALLRRLEAEYAPLEQAGCKVGIGVATGADRQFIGPYEALDVEEDRKLPLATTKDIVSGEVRWRGQGVINPFAPGGKLVDLAQYPRLRRYLLARKDAIAGRHCAKKSPERWYRTIDRIWPELVARPKLLIPDIKGEAHIVFEEGKLYPHHNLYYVISSDWDLRALQAVLLSSITRLFIATYSTQMRGGFLRFQAQYLRKLRLPDWSSVGPELRDRLMEAARCRDLDHCNQATFDLYGLSTVERTALAPDQTR